MPRKINVNGYIGKNYGSLTVLREADTEKGGTHVECECSCGEIIVRRLSYLKSGNITSCGCKGLPKIGTILESTSGLRYELIEYKKVIKGNGFIRRPVIRFLATGFIKMVDLKEFKNGSVKDLTQPNIAGIGFIGEGHYKTSKEDAVCYQTWSDMIKRCYAPKNKQIEHDYKDVEVCDAWHNYQVFAEWFYKHHIEGFRLDKDLQDLTKRYYSPETCTFLPIELNSFFTGGLKRGIYYSTSKGKWIAQCQNGEFCASSGKKRQTYLGAYISEEEALKVYKDFKRSKLESLLEEYSDYITPEIISNTHKIIDDLK